MLSSPQDILIDKHEDLESWESFKEIVRQVTLEYIHKHYQILGILSQTQNSIVKLAISKRTGDQVVCKILNKDKYQDPEQRESLYYKIKLLSRLRNKKHINELYDALCCSDQIWLILEYANAGDLSHYLSKRRRLSEQVAHKFFIQILHTVNFLHSHNIAHQDLKLENIILADFGFAHEIPQGQFTDIMCGTPQYSSPEILRGEAHDPYLSDCWALGVILYLLLVGRYPFPGPSIHDFLKQAMIGTYSIPDHVSASAADLISRLLCKEPSERLTVKDACSHPWINPANALPPLESQSSYKKLTNTNIPLKSRQVSIQKMAVSDSAIKVSALDDLGENDVFGRPRPRVQLRNQPLSSKVQEETNVSTDFLKEETIKQLSQCRTPSGNYSPLTQPFSPEDLVAYRIIQRRLLTNPKSLTPVARRTRGNSVLLKRPQTVIFSQLKTDVVVLPKPQKNLKLNTSKTAQGLSKVPSLPKIASKQRVLIHELIDKPRGPLPKLSLESFHNTLEPPENVWKKILSFILDSNLQIVWSEEWNLYVKTMDDSLSLTIELGYLNKGIGMIGYSLTRLSGSSRAFTDFEHKIEEYLTF